jgi:hypothetical protein
MAVNAQLRLITFEEAIATASKGNKHALLGNGFSRACRNDIFAYDALFKRADFTKLPNAQKAFSSLNTTDFEVVMNALRRAAALVEVYEPTNAALAKLFRDEADALREVLASAIAQNHPELPADIEPEQYRACRKFLNNFNTVYTLNYDLLLYWAIMQDEIEQPLELGDDGFRRPDDRTPTYVTWDVQKTNDQDVFYLHGALHLFDAGHELKKYTWVGTGVRLIEQIRDALKQNMFPLIVSEGTSPEKMSHIQHSNYLGRGFRSISQIRGSLYIYGFAMGTNDEHWLRLIEGNRGLKKLCVGIYGEQESPGNQHLIKRSFALKEARSVGKNPLEVTFFDAATAKVWG